MFKKLKILTILFSSVLFLTNSFALAPVSYSLKGVNKTEITRPFYYPAGNIDIVVSNLNNNYTTTSAGSISVGMSMLYRQLFDKDDKEHYPSIFIAPKEDWIGEDGSNLMQIYFAIAANYFFHGRETKIVCRPDQKERIIEYLKLGNPYYLPNPEKYLSDDLIKQFHREGIYLADRKDGKMINTFEHMIDFRELESESNSVVIDEITITSLPDGNFEVIDLKNTTKKNLSGNNLKELELKIDGVNPLLESDIPDFGVTFLGTSGGMDNNGLSSNQIIWAGEDSGKNGFLVDLNPATISGMKALELSPENINQVVITHLHEDHVAGALAYFQWAQELNQPIRLAMEPGIYELFKKLVKQLKDIDLENHFQIEFTSLRFYEDSIFNDVTIQPIPAFHGTPGTMLRFRYNKRVIFHTSDHTIDPYRVENILKNIIPENIREELSDVEKSDNIGYDKNKPLFDQKRADEIINEPFKENPEIVICETGNPANPANTNASNHTTLYLEMLQNRENLIVNHCANTADSGLVHAVPFSTWTGDKLIMFHQKQKRSGDDVLGQAA